MMWAEAGQEICMKCPVNTYMDQEGATACLPCEHGYSPEGSTECTDFTRNCTLDDAIRIHTECTQENGEWKETVYYEWATPLFCDNSTTSLPDPEEAPCGTYSLTDYPCPGSLLLSKEPCQGSAVYNAQTGCTYCRAGQFRYVMQHT